MGRNFSEKISRYLKEEMGPSYPERSDTSLNAGQRIVKETVYPGETVERGDNPKWGLWYEPEPTTGETVIYSIDQDATEIAPQEKGER